ncbi:MAG: ATP-binding protein [Epsilonproteobacteria bacterium]|nr:ATP-binding protein [Campylobacterota bacterium]
MSEHGNAIVSIKNIVDDLPSTVNWKQAVYEAITNSIQANATDIKINFIQDALDIKETKKYIIAIEIEDNGDGFTEDNLNAFKEYKTKHKRELGCKGISRFYI